ncbi:hypothetical protein GDO81_019357, partial [Engystomops pustulosus]
VLDPARPLFQGQPKEVTIDAGDADFVMAVHTDTGTVGLGIQTLVGHVDFFPNGGKQMPGCDGSQILDFDLTKGLLIATRDVVLCNHVFSYKVSIAAILNPDGFMGYCADDEDSFKKGAGFPCKNDSCSLMSFFNNRRNTTSCRKYYLITGPHGDFARKSAPKYKRTRTETFSLISCILPEGSASIPLLRSIEMGGDKEKRNST